MVGTLLENSYMKKYIYLLLVAVLVSFGSAWKAQEWRYDAKLLNQEKLFYDTQKVVQEKHLETIKELNLDSKKQSDWFQSELGRIQDDYKKLETANTELSASIGRLRDTEVQLRARIRTLPNETIRDYALSASTALREITEALRDEQLAHQETSRKADEYHSAWRALDQAWPIAK